MSWKRGDASPNKSGDEDLYDYDYSIDLNPTGGAVPGTGFGGGVGFNKGPGTAQPQRLMTGANAGRMMTGQASRMGTAGGGAAGELRPMTSVSGAGYQSAKAPKSFDPLNQRGAAPALAERADNSPEEMARDLEKQVNALLEKSAFAAEKGDNTTALEHAKEAGKKERALCKHRESNGLVDQINIDLTYAVCFNLANAHHKCLMYDTAIHTYGLLVKNKQYPQAGRLRVNMGNIYYEQKKWPQAIKMYRMALDQIPNTGKEVRFKIFRNIGNAFVRLGQFQDAIPSYETIMGGNPDFQTGFNLILCYLALGDGEKMKRGFSKLLSIPIQGMSEDDEAPEESKAVDDAEAVGARQDGLRQELKRRQREANQYILTAARLVTPQLDKKDWSAGFKWAIDILKPDHENIASELEIDMALMHLKRREFDKAIEMLKMFEKKDQHHRAMAATNLSFIYFLEQEYAQAEKYADLAYTNDRYNAKALVNKGNCLLVKGDFEMAKQFYLEAIGVEADCVEAIYNLGLVNVKMGNYQEAQQAFEKLHTIIPHNPEVIYQIANLYEQTNDLVNAIKWFNILSTRVPSDPFILARMGQLFTKHDDESQAFHYHLESYRHYPVSLDVISWLGVWYVKSELYEKAIHFFERASQIQPDEVKWRLMVTSCYRRMHNYQKALELYESIHAEHPDNLECLRYLVAICKDLGRPYDTYQHKLSRLDRAAASQTQTGRGGALTRVGGMEGGNNPAMGGGGMINNEMRASMAQRTTGALGRVEENRGGGGRQSPSGVNGNINKGKATDDDDDGFGDTDVGDLLPGM
jgi:intraflagellar transport protein 88